MVPKAGGLVLAHKVPLKCEHAFVIKLWDFPPSAPGRVGQGSGRVPHGQVPLLFRMRVTGLPRFTECLKAGRGPGLLISKLPTPYHCLLHSWVQTAPLPCSIPATEPTGPSPHPFLTLLFSLSLRVAEERKRQKTDPAEEKRDLPAHRSPHILAMGLKRAGPIPEGLWEIPGPEWVLLAQ